MIFSSITLVVVILLGLAVLTFEVWMFVNVIVNKNIDTTRKILWIIGMLLIHPFVAIGYYFTDYKRSK
jgi:hypothetical protein